MKGESQPMPPADPQIFSEGRVARRQRLVRQALLEAAGHIMREKGVDGATMLEIAEAADVGAGTIYNYFRSKDELAVAVLEQMMDALARRIEEDTHSFADPARIYALGVRRVLETATQDLRWRQMLHRSEVVSEATYRCMGPFAIRDIRRATEAGRFHCADPALTWRMACHVIMGSALAIINGQLEPAKIDAIVEGLLAMAGLEPESAKVLAHLSTPPS